MLRRLWKDHSLTVTLVAIGSSLTALSFLFEEGQWFDVVLGFGQGTLTAALVFVLSPFLRETAKPED